jgi:hypothetical protein
MPNQEELSEKRFWVAQRFQRCGMVDRNDKALAAEVLMAAPHRGNAGYVAGIRLRRVW